jgi:hypothetical protein
MKSSEMETRVTEQAVTKTELLNASSEGSAKLAFFLLIVLVGLFLMLTPVKAQGFLPGDIDAARGTIDDVLKGAGTLGNTIGGLGNLIDDFSWDKFIGFACNAATTVDGAEQTTTSGDVKSITCDIASFYEEVKGLAEDNQLTIDDIAKSFFSETSLADLGLGFVTSEQLQGWGTRLNAALDSENPQDGLRLAEEIYREIGQTEYENSATTNMNSPDGIISMAPALELGRAFSIQETARNGVQQFQATANTQGSSDIARAQAESDFTETLGEGVKDTVAPAIRNEAYSAVSTRATVQEVVNSITAYMAQDADQFAYLSSQLTLQAQQEVYTTHTLQLVANSLLEDQSRETRSRQAELNTAITNNISSVQNSGDKFTGALRSFLSLDGQHDPVPDLEF